jgi:hypothetical protein
MVFRDSPDLMRFAVAYIERSRIALRFDGSALPPPASE